MKVYIFLFLLGFITIATCQYCQWSQCAGHGYFGQSICDNQNLGRYMSQWMKSDCDWDSSRVLCCKYTSCQWSKCYGTAYNRDVVCSHEYGGWKASGNMEYCGTAIKYECCPPQ